VLLDDDQSDCESLLGRSSHAEIVAIAVVVPAVVFLAVFGAIMYLYVIPKIKLRVQLRAAEKDQRGAQMDAMSFERVYSIETTTTAGNFSVQM
jgi:hypothetical protein